MTASAKQSSGQEQMFGGNRRYSLFTAALVRNINNFLQSHRPQSAYRKGLVCFIVSAQLFEKIKASQDLERTKSFVSHQAEGLWHVALSVQLILKGPGATSRHQFTWLAFNKHPTRSWPDQTAHRGSCEEPNRPATKWVVSGIQYPHSRVRVLLGHVNKPLCVAESSRAFTQIHKYQNASNEVGPDWWREMTVSVFNKWITINAHTRMHMHTHKKNSLQ